MRLGLLLCASSLVLFAGAARAVNEASEDSILAIQEKVERDDQVAERAESLRQEQARRAEAEKRVERIRNLPPERVQDWIDGKLSEADLERLSAEPQSRPQEPEAVAAVPRSRLTRLILVGITTLVLAFVFQQQRRRERAASLKKRK